MRLGAAGNDRCRQLLFSVQGYRTTHLSHRQHVASNVHKYENGRPKVCPSRRQRTAPRLSSSRLHVVRAGGAPGGVKVLRHLVGRRQRGELQIGIQSHCFRFDLPVTRHRFRRRFACKLTRLPVPQRLGSAVWWNRRHPGVGKSSLRDSDLG